MLAEAVRWTSKAWDSIKKETIRNCWSKSTILEVEETPTQLEPPEDLLHLLREAQTVGEIAEDSKDYKTFMASKDEDKEPEEQVDLQEIIDYYTGKVGLEEAPEESSPEPAPPPP